MSWRRPCRVLLSFCLQLPAASSVAVVVATFNCRGMRNKCKDSAMRNQQTDRKILPANDDDCNLRGALACVRVIHFLHANLISHSVSRGGWAERGERLLEIRQSHYVIMIWNERTHMMCAGARHRVRSTTARNLCEILELRLCSAAFTQANQKPQCAYVTLDTVLCKVSKAALNCSSIKPRG